KDKRRRPGAAWSPLFDLDLDALHAVHPRGHGGDHVVHPLNFQRQRVITRSHRPVPKSWDRAPPAQLRKIDGTQGFIALGDLNLGPEKGARCRRVRCTLPRFSLAGKFTKIAPTSSVQNGRSRRRSGPPYDRPAKFRFERCEEAPTAASCAPRRRVARPGKTAAR